MNPEAATTAGTVSEEGGRGGIDSPLDIMRNRMSEARRMAGDIRVVLCDPMLCQPVP